MSEIHNLDDSISEYFEFVFKGHRYKFRHLTTEEVDEMAKIETSENSDKKLREYLYTFVSKTDDSSPEFSESAKDMILPQWSKFRDMLKTEFGA